MKDWQKYLLRDACIGFTSGLLVSITGAIKDAPYEGFERTKFIRSPIIGAIEAPIIGKAFKEPHPILLGLATIACERITTEAYKLARARMPGKFAYGEWGAQVLKRKTMSEIQKEKLERLASP